MSYKLIRSGFESFDIFNAGATNKKKKFLNFSVDLFETIVVLSTDVSSIFRLRYIDHFDKWLYHSPEDFRHGAVSRLRQEASFMFVDCCFKTGRLELEASCGVSVFPLDILVGSACL